MSKHNGNKTKHNGNKTKHNGNKTKHNGIFTKIFTILFSKRGKTENMPELDFERFPKNIFWRFYTYSIYIVKLMSLILNSVK